MSFVNWLVEGLHHWTIYIQIACDTGWYYDRFQNMGLMSRRIHDKLVTWISKSKHTPV